MVTEIEMLNCIHQNADMAKDSLEHILPMSTDSAFTKELEKQKAEYARAYQKSEALLRERPSSQATTEDGIMTQRSSVILAALLYRSCCVGMYMVLAVR